MWKMTTKLLAATMLVGASAAQMAAASPQVAFDADDRQTVAQGTFKLADVRHWEHVHKCNPSPCKKRRDRHKMGTGSVTESPPSPPPGVGSLQGKTRR